MKKETEEEKRTRYEFLLEHLGNKILSYAVEFNEDFGWLSNMLTAKQDMKTRYLEQIVKILIPYGKTMFAWLWGTNKHLGEQAPIYIIRYGNKKDCEKVLAAAKIFAG